MNMFPPPDKDLPRKVSFCCETAYAINYVATFCLTLHIVSLGSKSMVFSRFPTTEIFVLLEY